MSLNLPIAMMKMVVVNMNKQGFTLIELLGVIVVLTLIGLIAIPSIASTIERNKNKINEEKKEIICSAAEIYVSKNKLDGSRGVDIQTLLDDNLLTEDELKNSNNSDYLFPPTYVVKMSEGICVIENS